MKLAILNWIYRTHAISPPLASWHNWSRQGTSSHLALTRPGPGRSRGQQASKERYLIVAALLLYMWHDRQ